MRILSGFQPSGKFHLGNYFGSIRPNIEYQHKSDVSFFMIADLHSLTSLRDAAILRECIEDNILDFLACGFDPNHSILFRQSDIPEHAELAWILSTICPMGLMERAVSYKDKIDRGLDATVGLFTYPILQTADILLYDIEKVPVGKDQKQHIEMARDLAIKFNHTFGEVFVVPEPVIAPDVAVVPGTDGQKMSKSYGNTIPLFGDEKAIKKAIMGIVTDSKDIAEPKDPETCVIYQLHKLLLSTAQATALADKYRAGGLGYGEAKQLFLQAYLEYFALMRAKRAELLQKPGVVGEIATMGAKKASLTAKATLQRVYQAVGLR